MYCFFFVVVGIFLCFFFNQVDKYLNNIILEVIERNITKQGAHDNVYVVYLTYADIIGAQQNYT